MYEWVCTRSIGSFIEFVTLSLYPQTCLYQCILNQIFFSIGPKQLQYLLNQFDNFFTFVPVCEVSVHFLLLQEVVAGQLPGIMHALRMIYMVSTHYNTSERLMKLFLKVTNQLIITCKSYILEGVSKHLWELPRYSLSHSWYYPAKYFTSHPSIK